VTGVRGTAPSVSSCAAGYVRPRRPLRPAEFTLDELRQLAYLMESVVASRHRDGLPARLAELINLGR
jgi:hypothetical protein